MSSDDDDDEETDNDANVGIAPNGSDGDEPAKMKRQRIAELFMLWTWNRMYMHCAVFTGLKLYKQPYTQSMKNQTRINYGAEV